MPLRSLCLAFVLAGAVMAQGQTLSWSWIKETILDRIQISGSRTLGYHSYTVEGDREAFNLLNNYGYGLKRWTDVGQVTLQGRNVAGFANFQANLDTNRFSDPQAQSFTLDYNKRPYRLTVGDINGSLLNTNRFAVFRKSLVGVQGEFKQGRLAVRGLVSESKGAARTISIQGTNSAGPYYLNIGQIVRGSEEVMVDGELQVLGQDYVISYESGSITFVSRIIPPTSTIVVSFEAFGFGSSRGDIQGASATYDFGKYGRLGVTAMRQTTGADGSLSQRVELFQGGGPASTPYFLLYEPLPGKPVIVKLDGQVQTEGIDYRFDPENPTVFFFLRFVPLTSTIQVIYTPRPTQTVDGDREVLGIDYRIPLGNQGSITYSQATGKLKSPVNPLSGTARGIDANYRIGRYTMRAGWRDVPNGYVSVETRGFNRNERAYDLGVTYEATGLRVEAGHVDSQVGLRRTTSGGGVEFRTADTQTSRLTYEDTRRTGEPWRLDLTRMKSRTDDGQTELTTAAASTSRTFGNLIARAVLESQVGRAPLQTGSKIRTENLGLNTIRLETSYADRSPWTFNANLGVSHVRAGDKDGMGTDYALTASYNPSDRLSVNANYTRSNSGQLAILSGFNTGFGLGYNGNGYSGGISGPQFVGGVSDYERVVVASTYQISDRMALVGSIYRNRYAGSASSNAVTEGADLAFDVILGAESRAYLNVSQVQTRFLESPQRSNTTILGVGVMGRIGTRWNYDVRGLASISGGTDEFGQDDLGFDFDIRYALARRQDLIASTQYRRTTGYLPRDDFEFVLAHRYQLWRSLALVTSYKIRDVRNHDGSPTGAYKARGFDIELRFAF